MTCRKAARPYARCITIGSVVFHNRKQWCIVLLILPNIFTVQSSSKSQYLHIFLFAHFTSFLFVVVETFTCCLLRVNPKKKGSVTAGLGIYDTMQYVAPEISTLCVGQACSMGSLLLAAGAPGKRYSLPNSRIMVHQPSGGAQGQSQLLKAYCLAGIQVSRRPETEWSVPPPPLVTGGCTGTPPGSSQKSIARYLPPLPCMLTIYALSNL